MRVYFLTLRVDNLPETERRQYENKKGVRVFDAKGKEKNCVAVLFFSAERNAAGAERAATSEPDSNSWMNG